MAENFDEVGSLGAEATKLINAVQDWARRASADAPIATGAPECQWCPVCQLIGVLRGDRPELAERAGAAARAAVTALIAAFSAPHDHGSPPASEARAPGPDGPAARPPHPARRVERIDLFDEHSDADDRR